MTVKIEKKENAFNVGFSCAWRSSVWEIVAHKVPSEILRLEAHGEQRVL